VIDLSAAAGAAATPPAPAPPPALRACLFVLAGSLYAVDVRSAREVAVFDGFTVVPRAPAWLLGVANLRGVVMPIVDVRPHLGLSAHRPGAVIKGLIVEHATIQVAVAIEAALGLEPFTEVIPDTRPGESSLPTRRRFVAGFLPRGEEMVTLLDVPIMLGALAHELRTADQAEEDRR
jgi:purine-binding chemotaxis protein CheW